MDKQLKDTIEEQGWWIERGKYYCEWTLFIITPHDLEYEFTVTNSTFLDNLLEESDLFNEDRFVAGCDDIRVNLHYEDAVNDAKWLRVKLHELYNSVKDLKVFNENIKAEQEEVK